MKNEYIFQGRIYPERKNVTVSPIDLNSNGYSLKVFIKNSQVTLIFESEKSYDVGVLKNNIEHVMRVLVSTQSFVRGYFYDIEIISVVYGNNLMIFEPSIEDIVNYEGRNINLSKLFNLALDDFQLQHALNNLRLAITNPGDTSFYCHRAIECIRQNFKDKNGGTDIESWGKMGEALKIKQSWAKNLSECSIRQRHGIMEPIDTDSRTTFLQKAWIVVDRYYKYVTNIKEIEGLELLE